MNGRWTMSGGRYKTGASVLYDGFYIDSWGGELMLLSGERFPGHPQMGPTTWTYEAALTRSQPVHASRRSVMSGR